MGDILETLLNWEKFFNPFILDKPLNENDAGDGSLLFSGWLISWREWLLLLTSTDFKWSGIGGICCLGVNKSLCCSIRAIFSLNDILSEFTFICGIFIYGLFTGIVLLFTIWLRSLFVSNCFE